VPFFPQNNRKQQRVLPMGMQKQVTRPNLTPGSLGWVELDISIFRYPLVRGKPYQKWDAMGVN